MSVLYPTYGTAYAAGPNALWPWGALGCLEAFKNHLGLLKPHDAKMHEARNYCAVCTHNMKTHKETIRNKE